MPQAACPGRAWRLVLVDVSTQVSHRGACSKRLCTIRLRSEGNWEGHLWVCLSSQALAEAQTRILALVSPRATVARTLPHPPT